MKANFDLETVTSQTLIAVIVWLWLCVFLPGFAAANYSDHSSAGGSVACRRLLPVDLSPALLSVGIQSSAIQRSDRLHSLYRAV